MSRLPKHFCALWSQHLPCRCFSLFIAPEWYSGAFSRKSTFLEIPISFTSLIPSPILPTDEREKTERTTAQLPADKKCCLLIFAIAIGCLVLAAIPASSPPFSFLSAVMLSRFRPREFPHLYTILFTPSTKKIALKAILICIFAKNIVPLHPKAQRRGLEGERCPPLGKPNHLTQSPVVAFKTYLKGVYYALFWLSEISQISRIIRT